MEKNVTQKGVFLSSFAMAFAGLGDALLYPVLPVYGEEMGFSVFWIGVFLSINRFIRIPGNSLVGYLISIKGLKNAMLVATFFAMLTTFTYGFEIGIFLFLIARIFWGLSYATMRISSLAYASGVQKNVNLMFGLVQSIKTTSAVLSLFVGSYLVKVYSVKISFIVLGAFSLPAIFFASKLPALKMDTTKIDLKKILNFSSINILTFLTSFIIDGVLVITISKLLDKYSISELIVVVSGYLLFRKLCSAVLSAVSGWMSDAFGVEKVFRISLFFILGSLLLITVNNSEIGIAIAFLFNSIFVAMLPSIALKINPKNRLTTLTSITTWWDIGAALGTFLGLYLLKIIGYKMLFGTLFCLQLLAVAIFLKKSASFLKVKHLQGS